VVTWTGVPGFRDPYYQANFFSPLPRHQLDGMENSELQQAEISARLPLGWGPYMLSEWSPGDRLVADRNPYYVGADDGRPYFDQVIFRFVGAKEIGLVDKLIGEGCDLIAGTALDGDYETYLALDQQGAVRLHSTPSSVWEHLDFGIDPVPQYDWRGDYFQDPRMRQATAYCLNREAIADEIMAGLATVLNAYIPPAHPLYATVSASDYPYEPATGSALLDQVGWRDTNGDGVREAYGVDNLVDGTTLVFNYVTTTSELRQRVAEMVANDLSQCGMRVNIIAEPVPPETFFGTSSDSPIFGRSFDVTSFAWLADMLPPCHLFLSSEIPTSTNGWSGFNVGGYNNPNYDAACNSARRSLPGTDEFVANHREALRIFIEELPAVPLFTHVSAAVSRPDIEGVIVDPTESAVTWNLENFRLRE
jgi:peptide/nickel transport system substrate-binding protein